MHNKVANMYEMNVLSTPTKQFQSSFMVPCDKYNLAFVFLYY